MEGEHCILLDASVDAADKKQKGSSSKLPAALLAFTLCLAAAAAVLLVFNNHTKGPEPDQDSFELHHTLRHISNVRAAIHLEGEYSSSVKTSVEWKTQVDQSFNQGDLRFNNNEIVISRTGLYFVYSQASFRVSCSSSDEDDDDTSKVHLSHTVQRWSPSFGDEDTKRSYQTIMHSVRTACQRTASTDTDEDGSWFSAVYMGAVFNLRTGDRLRTVMEEKMLKMLEDGPGKTFFGVFAL
ncbi:tumor necrosis factor a (TNF superfamily, member 2) [Embiotoca jacksoni]|uniref:tumor necrosis factor a (TNF superfamily, member 2) n=1 Tax=Embiotoca jacksoni TaxID=100190 RepID=UPI003703EDD4